MHNIRSTYFFGCKTLGSVGPPPPPPPVTFIPEYPPGIHVQLTTEKCTFLLAQFPSVYPNNPIIIFLLTSTSIPVFSGEGNLQKVHATRRKSDMRITYHSIYKLPVSTIWFTATVTATFIYLCYNFFHPTIWYYFKP